MNDHEIVRKYRKKVNENGWMRKYQRWCFGSLTPRFVGYCPFFWFTWICVLFLPLILVGKILEPIGKILKLVLTFTPKVKTKEVRKPNDVRLIDFYKVFLAKTVSDDVVAIRIELEKYFPDVYAWIDENPLGWETYCKRILIESERRAKKKERSKAQREKVVAFLAYYCGKIAKPIVIMLGLLISFYVLRFMWWVVQHITWADVFVAFKIILVVLVASAVFSVLVRFFRLVKNAIANRSGSKKLANRATPIGTFFDSLVDGIATGLSFCTETIEMIYKQECPLIEWSDKSSSIKTNE